MLKGELSGTTLAQVLRPIADSAATGCLRIDDPAGAQAKVFLRRGRVYMVLAPGDRPALGSLLVDRGDLSVEHLEQALDAQADELQGWRLSELLVHLGLVAAELVESAVSGQVRAALADVLPWGAASWRFRVNERTRDDVAPPVELDVLLAAVAHRPHWTELLAVVHGLDGVPMLAAAGTASSELSIAPQAWSLLCKVDGERTLTALAREARLPVYETAALVSSLVGDGLLEVAAAASDEAVGPSTSFVPSGVADRLAQALSSGSYLYDMDRAGDDAPRHLSAPADERQVDGSLSRVSESLSALLGPVIADDDVFAAPARRHLAPADDVGPPEPVPARRERDAAELQLAQAELEQAKVDAGRAEADDHLASAEHAAAMAELRDSASRDAAAPPSSEIPAQSEGFDDAAPHEDWPMVANQEADTASLLRELSFLGLDDDPPAGPAPRTGRPPAPRAPATSALPKKRKGIFGR